MRVISQPNAGAAAARNHGWRESSGSWIAFLDSDDEWLPGKIKRQLQELKANPQAILVYGGARIRQPDGSSSAYVYSATVSSARPPSDYTARVMPHRDGVAIPLEEGLILWQR